MRSDNDNAVATRRSALACALLLTCLLMTTNATMTVTQLPTCPAHGHGGGGALNVYRNHSMARESSAFHHAIRLELRYADNRIDERKAGNLAVKDHVRAFALQGTVLKGRYRI